MMTMTMTMTPMTLFLLVADRSALLLLSSSLSLHPRRASLCVFVTEYSSLAVKVYYSVICRGGSKRAAEHRTAPAEQGTI